jgi:hypothetical protein
MSRKPTETRDLIGEQYGYWRIIGNIEKRGHSLYRECICTKCGATKSVQQSDLLTGRSKSCIQCSNGYNDNGLTSKAKTIVWHIKRNNKYRLDLSVQQIKEIIIEPCFYCGESDSSKYRGIDRIDNSCGYNLHNTVPCCATCNQMKSTIDVDDFLKKIYLIASQ